MAKVTRDGSNPFVLSWLALAIGCFVVGVAALVTGKWIGVLFFVGTLVGLGAHFGTNSVSRNFVRKADAEHD